MHKKFCLKSQGHRVSNNPNPSTEQNIFTKRETKPRKQFVETKPQITKPKAQNSNRET